MCSSYRTCKTLNFICKLADQHIADLIKLKCSTDKCVRPNSKNLIDPKPKEVICGGCTCRNAVPILWNSPPGNLPRRQICQLLKSFQKRIFSILFITTSIFSLAFFILMINWLFFNNSVGSRAKCNSRILCYKI